VRFDASLAAFFTPTRPWPIPNPPRKRARQTLRRTAINKRNLTAVKNQLKNVRDALKGGAKDKAKSAAATFFSTIDKAVRPDACHRNAAARHKSRLSSALAKLA